MGDPREELLLDLDNSKTRVINAPAYVVICGGPINVQPGNELSSARNIFLTSLTATHTDLADKHLLPEDFKEWNHHGVYPDLLSFETDLAHLMGAIVIFVESAGSIAELGSFSCIPAIAKKLFIILRGDFYREDSFIRWGPIKRLEDEYANSVFVYDWKEDNSDFPVYVSDLVHELRLFLTRDNKSEAFSDSSVKHILLLIADITDLFVIVRQTDIREWLNKFFRISLSEHQLRRYLFLLIKLKLIIEVPYGKNRFYIRPKNANPYIEYGTLTSGFKQDRTRLKTKVLAFYENADETRARAWKQARPGSVESA